MLALQGGVVEHRRMLTSLGADAVAVRRPAQLADLEGIVLPGGESSTQDRLLRLFGLAGPLAAAITDGLPTLGTCAGMVLLATRVLDPAPGQQSLQVLDIDVRRNAFGPQIDSESSVVDTTDGPVAAAFIRAPEVVRVGDGVQVIARHRDRVVGIRAGAVTAIAFHPELTGDATLHREFLTYARKHREQIGAPGGQAEPFQQCTTGGRVADR